MTNGDLGRIQRRPPSVPDGHGGHGGRGVGPDSTRSGLATGKEQFNVQVGNAEILEVFVPLVVLIVF